MILLAAPKPTDSNHRVLLVDDDPRARDLLARVLKHGGFDVTCAGELEEAAAILEFRDYDALCVDLDLRGLCGLEGLELIGEAHQRRPQLPIVVQTGNSDPDVHRACLANGACGVFVKGRPMNDLLRLLGRPTEEEEK